MDWMSRAVLAWRLSNTLDADRYSGMFRAATLTASGVIRSVSEMLHDLARFRAVFLDVGVIARGRRQAIGRHAPQPFRGRQHGSADIPLPPTKHVDEGSAAQAQRHRPAEIGIIKRRRVAVDD